MTRSLYRRLSCVLFASIMLSTMSVSADDAAIRLHLPKRTKPTPVQQYNRDGVKALEKKDYNKAKQLFYKAYLLDPNDPFTLNNLGYIAELDGDIERAQRFYDLAAESQSDAAVDVSTTKGVIGKPVTQVAGKAEGTGLEVNRINVAAIALLEKDRAPEADVILNRALQADPKNPFTLNNLGYAKEKEGELEQALAFYDRAAATGSNDRVVVTVNKSWRGKPIADVASKNADSVRDLMRRGENTSAQVARLNLQGVSAFNRNERDKARERFQQAYKLDSGNAFTLNNMGYLAELDGDRETANFYYEKAQAAGNSNQRVVIATRKDVEGKPVALVADSSEQKVDIQLQAAVEARRREGGDAVLHRRDGTIVAAPAPGKPAETKEKQRNNTGQGGDQNLPASDQPSAPVTPQSQPQTQPQR